MPSHTEAERLKRKGGTSHGSHNASSVLTQTDGGAVATLQAGGGAFTTAEIQKGFATELRVLRAEAASGIISDPGRDRLDQLELILEERAAVEG